jgi:hypothetical protein
MTTSQLASPTIERLREDQISAAAEVLAHAFQNDPPLAYGIPDPAERARILPMFMKPFVTFASLFGEAYVTAGKLESVAIWLPYMDPASVQSPPSLLNGLNRLRPYIRPSG